MEKQRTDEAKFLLQLVLGFFSRVDSRASVVLGINTGMLALLAGKLPRPEQFDWKMSIAIVAVVCLTCSYWFLFKTAFPDLKGGTASLIYFREISKRVESKFIEDFSNQTGEEFYKDMLRQIWRNSEILSNKFNTLRRAFIWMLIAVIPWAFAVGIFESKSNEALKTLPQSLQRVSNQTNGY